MKYSSIDTEINFKFDFEIGYLIKSPCKACDNRHDFPRCADNCVLLDRIQQMLAGAISCTGKN